VPKIHPQLPRENPKEGLELFRLDRKEAYLVGIELLSTRQITGWMFILPVFPFQLS
jgi:hypothetical protein